MRDLRDLGWDPNDTPAVQTAAVQAVLDAGGLYGFTGPMVTDATLTMGLTSHIYGAGAASTITRLGDGDAIHMRARDCKLSGLHILGETRERAGCGIAIGPDMAGSYAIYCVVEDCHTLNHEHGVELRYFGGALIRGGMHWGQLSAIHSVNAVADSGDSKLIGADLNAGPTIAQGGPLGTCFLWEAGGGWTVANNKMAQGLYHVRILSYTGETGGMIFNANNYEGNVAINFDCLGNTRMKHLAITNSRIGSKGPAIVVRNYNVTPGDGGANHWLDDLIVMGNECENAAPKPSGVQIPIMDIGCCNHPVIGPNIYRGHGPGPASHGCLIRENVTGGVINRSASAHTNVATPAYVTSPSTAVIH